MRIAPPLTVTDSEIDLGVELLDAAIVRVMQALRRPAGDHDTREQGQAAG